jgi:hypothetical protein
MAEAFFAFNRAGVLLAERLDYNDAEDDSREVALMLRYYTTADRAFNRNLHDLRKLQKERELEEVGFVSQDDQPEPETEPEAEPEKPSAQPAAPGIRPVIVIETPKTPDSTLESSPQPAPKAA